MGAGVGVAVGAAVGVGVGIVGVIAIPLRMPPRIGKVLLEYSSIELPMKSPISGVSGLNVHESVAVAVCPAPDDRPAGGGEPAELKVGGAVDPAPHANPEVSL